ncbi:phosphoribosyltransferase [Candidatus Nitrospira bockiana]
MSRDEYVFHDRHDAGQQLARALHRYRHAPDAVVLALPRGGVVIGYEISRALELPLDVFVTRKLGTPGNPELAMGALAETGYRHLNEDVMAEFEVSDEQLEAEVRRQQDEIERRIRCYRHGGPLVRVTGRTVMLVDDGIATGATLYASLAALRALHPGRLIVAAPVAPPHIPHDLQSKVDEAVILQTPALFFGIGQFYEHFEQVSDQEVVRCLEACRRTGARAGSECEW